MATSLRSRRSADPSGTPEVPDLALLDGARPAEESTAEAKALPDEVSAGTEGELASAEPIDLAPLRELIQRAQLGALTSYEGEQLATGFGKLAGAPDRAAADLVLEALTIDSLALYRHEGLTLRTWATEALLDLGHPFALEVTPEALDEALEDRAARDRRRDAPWIGWGIVGAGGLISLGTVANAPADMTAFAAGFGVVVEAIAYGFPVWAASSRLEALKRHLGMFGIAALALLEIGIGMTHSPAQGWALALGGAVKLLSIPYFRLRKSLSSGRR